MATTQQIRFNFDERKTAAAAALFLELAGGRMPYLQLVKLLYFADREALERLGRSISGDRYVSMKHGPVLSHVYDLVKWGLNGKSTQGPWFEHIGNVERYQLELLCKADLGPLSEAEIGIIRAVFTRYCNLDRWDLRDETHNLAEWGDPGDSSREIPIEEILRVLGKSDAEIEEVRQDARERAHFDSIFGA